MEEKTKMDDQVSIPQIKNDEPDKEDEAQKNEFVFAPTDNVSIDCENWMRNLPHHLTAAPLIYLSIPGSHNSFTYSLTRRSRVSPDSPPSVQRLGKWFRTLTTPIIYKWSKGQSLNTTQQLNSGIRYFDVRSVVKDGEIYIAHGLYGGLILTFLEELNNFLDLHSKEVVILDFQHFYNFEMEYHQKLMAFLTAIFNRKICRRQRRIRENTLNLLWHLNHQVIIIYRNSACRFSDYFWPSAVWPTFWPNVLKVDELISCLNKELSNRQRGTGYVSQWILTPTPKYVAFHLFKNLKSMSSQASQKLNSWLETKQNGVGGLNVVICDFVERHNFCEKVILLNYKKLFNFKQHFDTSEDPFQIKKGTTK